MDRLRSAAFACRSSFVVDALVSGCFVFGFKRSFCPCFVRLNPENDSIGSGLIGVSTGIERESVVSTNLRHTITNGWTWCDEQTRGASCTRTTPHVAKGVNETSKARWHGRLWMSVSFARPSVSTWGERTLESCTRPTASQWSRREFQASIRPCRPFRSFVLQSSPRHLTPVFSPRARVCSSVRRGRPLCTRLSSAGPLSIDTFATSRWIVAEISMERKHGRPEWNFIPMSVEFLHFDRRRWT